MREVDSSEKVKSLKEDEDEDEMEMSMAARQ
jgi:hypothetical protein